MNGLGTCRVVIKDHHFFRPVTARGTDGWTRVVCPYRWEAMQGISQ